MHIHDHASHHPHSSHIKTATIWIVALNIAFILCELFLSVLAHSTALSGDALHNLGDVFGIIASFIATFLAQRPATAKQTYGYGKASILAALSNSCLLLVGCGIILSVSIYHVITPHSVNVLMVIITGLIGFFINAITAYTFKDHHADLNNKMIFIHMVGDCAISAALICSALIIFYTHWMIVDPIIALFIVVFIIITGWESLLESFKISLDSVPAGIDSYEVQHWLLSLTGVLALHDLHIWPLSTKETALSVHLVHDAGQNLNKPFDLYTVERRLYECFKISHATIQLEKKSDICHLTKRCYFN